MAIILASQSPRRRELLGQMGLKGFKVTSPDVDEDVDENLHPSLVVEELSLRKAKAVAAHADEEDLIIAARAGDLGGLIIDHIVSRSVVFTHLIELKRAHSALLGKCAHYRAGVVMLKAVFWAEDFGKRAFSASESACE